MFKLIIAGSREFNDYSFLKDKVDFLLKNVIEDVEIVSGAARGADTLGERYAMENNFKVKLFPADWSKGRGAGFIRNEEMAEYANACVVFWMNNSKGTKHMIDVSQKHNLKLRIYKC
jgi:hypothetical protein